MILHLKKYCVYTHGIDGKVFYIGSGTCSRPFYFKQRNKAWNTTFKETDFIEVDIVGWYDTSIEAVIREKEEILSQKPLTNLRIGDSAHDKVFAGRKGGITKWARIPKKKRSDIMRKVAQARYANKEKTSPTGKGTSQGNLSKS